MIDPVGLLRRVTRRGALPGPLRWLAGRVGLVQVLTSRRTVEGLLAMPDVEVPYGDRSTPLGLGRFPLALDGPAHLDARALVAGALQASEAAHQDGVGQAGQVAEQALAAARSEVDLVAAVVDPALARWAEVWFGLPGDGARLLRSARLATHATFLNPPVPAMRPDLWGREVAAGHLRDHAAAVCGALAAAPAGSLGAALRDVTAPDDELAAQHVLGLTVGPLALGSEALARCFALLVREPWRWPPAGDPAAAGAAFRMALRQRPPLPGVLRVVPTARPLDGERGPVDVPAGLVLAATACPMRDGGAPDLVFGAGSHACLGERQITEVAAEIVAAVAARGVRRLGGRRGRLRDGEPPSGVERWPFPGHLRAGLL